ncbi:50S ribosomal protein L3 [archaeon]|nr:50S ribosomal protein L3 [archaeon]|tara:strand:+ start:6556 stop:7569 length:1014 start_codon:yes stop_codon:yes gene_type:complete
MGKAHSPRHGSWQFWPRKRSRHSFVRVRSWANSKDAKPLGFIGYKAGMTHLMMIDSRGKSTTSGEKIQVPVTIVECPQMFALGAAFYSKDSRGKMKKITDVFATEIPKDWRKVASLRIPLAKKSTKKLENVTDFDHVRLITCSRPGETTVGAKKPQVIELDIGGSKDDALNYLKENLGKEIAASDVFKTGEVIDIRAVTKGKGFQGSVKRYGVRTTLHKSEKVVRGVAAMGAWTPKRVGYRIPQPGKMGYHSRSEYNKQIIKLGNAEEVSEINPKRGLHQYGLLKNNYMLIRGSIAGPRKKAVLLTSAIRSNSYKNKAFKGVPEVSYISRKAYNESR